MDQSAHRPRVCYLAYFFPPVGATATVRTGNTAIYLTRLGWNVSVMTPDPSMFWSVQESDRLDQRVRDLGVRRIITGHAARSLAAMYLKQPSGPLWRAWAKLNRVAAQAAHRMPQSGWVGPCMDADSAVPAGSYDLVLATVPPYEPFVLAERLARRHGCPYVLDYRDPWTGDPRWPAPHWQTRMEAALLQRARAVITVSSRHAKALRDRFDVRCPVEVIRNGFDVSDVAAVEPYQFDDPAIVYAGTLYPPTVSTIDPIMSAIARIDSSPTGRSQRYSFHYYGNTGRHVAESANRWGVTRRVKIHGVCPRKQAMSVVRGAAVAVVITHVGDTGSDADDLGIIPAKLYEAIGLGTPVLLVSPPGSDAEQVLAQVNGGKRFAGSDIEGIAEYLMQRITSPGRIAQDPGELSWDHLGRRLDAVLRAAIAEHRACTP